MLRMAPYPPVLDDIAAWLAGHDAESAAGTAFRFAVEAEGWLVGCADVDEIADGMGEIGYWFDEAVWARGYASEAAAAVVGFATTTLGLRRLESGHAADNPASGRVLARLGFRPVGEALRWYRSRREEVPHRTYRRDVAGA